MSLVVGHTAPHAKGGQMFLHIIQQAINNLRECQDSLNVIIRTEDGQVYRAHKEILCGCSAYFQALLSGPWSKYEEHQQHPTEVSLSSTSSKAVSTIIEFAYTGVLGQSLTLPELMEVLLLADRLIIPQACHQCEKRLSTMLNIRNCVKLYLMSNSCYCPYLKDKAKGFLMRTPINIWPTSCDFQTLSVDDLCELLEDDDLNIERKEENVFKLIFKWIEHDSRKRTGCLSRLVSTVRLRWCTRRFLRFTVNCNSLIRKDKTAQDHLKNWLAQEAPERFVDRDSYWQRPRTPQSVIINIGGCVNNTITSTIEMFNPISQQWSERPFEDRNYPRHYHGVVALGPNVYCLGGTDGRNVLTSVRKLHIESCKWSSVAHMQQPRCYAAYTTWDHYILAAGGCDNTKRLKNCELYDSTRNAWFNIASMRKCRSDASATTCRDRIFVAGGFDGVNSLYSVEMYLPRADKWCDVQGMNSPRSGLCLISYRSSLFAIGGENGTKILKTVELLPPNANKWCVVAKMRVQRSNFMAVVMDQELYIAGGYDGYNTLNWAEKFDLSTFKDEKINFMKNRKICNLAYRRWALASCVVNGPGLRKLAIEDITSADDSLDSSNLETERASYQTNPEN